MAQPKKVSAEWAIINKFFEGIDPDKVGDGLHYLGEVLKEYVEESIHGGWDGFESSDLTGVRKFLLDLITYHNNR